MGEYSVETKNRFQLILDDDEVDVYDILKEEEAKSEKKNKKNEPEVAKNVKNTKTEKSKKTQGHNKTDKANVVNIQNTSNKLGIRENENRPPRMRQQNNFPKSDNFERPPSTQDQQSSGGFGGRGSRRGGSAGFRGGRGGARGAPRRFDRHSGSERTGVKSVEKRDGFGPHNWGGEVDAQLDTSVQDGTQPTTTERTEGDGEEATINAEESGADADTPPAEPEVHEMTLDEWKAAQAGSRTKQQFNVRRAGEGEDPKQWKKTVALEPRKRAESTESYEYDEHELHDKADETRATLDKLNIQIRFSDNSRGGPSSGGRGGRGRGRGSFGGPRTDRPPRGGGGGGSGGFDRPPQRGGGGGGGFDRPPRGGGGGGGFDRPPRGGGGGGGFDRPPRGGGGGGFGAPRRGRGDYGGGGFNRSNRQENSAPRVDNESEFPSLGSK